MTGDILHKEHFKYMSFLRLKLFFFYNLKAGFTDIAYNVVIFWRGCTCKSMI